MAKVKIVMTVKTDKKLKENAQKIAHDMGFPLGTLINAFLRQFVKNKAIYFSTAPVFVMTEALENELGKIELDIAKDLNLSPQFDDMKDALKYLKKA